ncbi:MAG TPA: MBL fold metallo-hydrolase [Gemmatimonadaceae bacterium]|nr:MBL fold metallo-hydrolase [Gemmatimonadaceae bacterium]
MNSPVLDILTFETGPLQENAYLVVDRDRRDAAIVDPGDDGDQLIAAIEQAEAKLRAIWLTHAHFDHIGAVKALRTHFSVPVHLHEADIRMFEAGPFQAASYGLPFDGDEVPSGRFVDGQGLTLGGLSFTVMHTPGHSPGHVTIYGHGVALVGDCLFAGSIGRTDLPLGNGADLGLSLLRIVALPPETRVLPGHGPATTVAEERRSNPYILDLLSRVPR